MPTPSAEPEADSDPEASSFDVEVDGAAQLVSHLDTAVRKAVDGLPAGPLNGYVCSELSAVHSALQSVLDKDQARGPVFCEWGSGLGAVCAVASSLSFEAYGIEIQGGLVDAARDLVAEVGLDATFAHGSFLLPGDEDLVAGSDNTHAETSLEAWRELGLSPAGCDVVFAYPWPGEEEMHDRLFARHATRDALLLTFHEQSRVLVQRHMGAGEELQPLQWVG